MESSLSLELAAGHHYAEKELNYVSYLEDFLINILTFPANVPKQMLLSFKGLTILSYVQYFAIPS